MGEGVPFDVLEARLELLLPLLAVLLHVVEIFAHLPQLFLEEFGSLPVLFDTRFLRHFIQLFK